MLLSARRGPTCPLTSSTTARASRRTPSPATKKGSHSLPLATRMRPQRRRAGRRPVVVFVRGNHLYPHGGPAVSNLLTETSQLSSRDRAVWTVSEEFVLSLPSLLFLSRISDLIIFEYTTVAYNIVFRTSYREVLQCDLLGEFYNTLYRDNLQFILKIFNLL